MLISLKSKIKTLELQIEEHTSSGKNQTYEESKRRKQQAIEFIKRRISITTRSKYSGWGAQVRKVKAIEFTDSYLEKYGRYPTNDEILKFKTMEHPELETGVSDLMENLRSDTGPVSVSTLCMGGIYHSKDEQYIYDSIEKLCAKSEKLGSLALIKFPLEGVYKKENMIFECTVIETNPVDKTQTENKFNVRRISESEFKNLQKKWSNEDNEISALQFHYQAYKKDELLEITNTYNNLKNQS